MRSTSHEGRHTFSRLSCSRILQRVIRIIICNDVSHKRLIPIFLIFIRQIVQIKELYFTKVPEKGKV